MFGFNAYVDRKASDSIKWQKYHGRDIIPMWVADMDFTSPPEVLKALHERVSHGVFGYATPGTGLTETIAAHLSATYQWEISPGWIVWLPGLVCGLNVACRSVQDPRGRIVTTVPTYPPFLSAPGNAGRQLITSPLQNAEGRWLIDVEHLDHCMEDSAGMFILCNPHNPTGRVYTRNELTALADMCCRHDMLICSDEIHCDLILEPGCRHIPLATLGPEIADRTITLMAPSKTYNIPGLGCSFAIISNDSVRRRFIAAMAGIVPHVNALGLTAAQAAYAHGDAWLNELLDYLRDNRDLVFHSINAMPGMHMDAVEGTYLAWIDTRQRRLQDPGRFFEENGVGLSDGTEFGGPGFVRMNFGCSRPLLEEALARIGLALQNHPADTL